MAVKDYIRERFFPHLWCAGCGHGIILNGLIRAIEELGMRKNEIVMVSGIGCSSRISGYVDFHTLHILHGRALAFATGVKLSKPELNVIDIRQADFHPFVPWQVYPRNTRHTSLLKIRDLESYDLEICKSASCQALQSAQSANLKSPDPKSNYP